MKSQFDLSTTSDNDSPLQRAQEIQKKKKEQKLLLKILNLQLNISSLKKLPNVLQNENIYFNLKSNQQQKKIDEDENPGSCRNANRTKTFKIFDKFLQKYVLHEKIGEGASAIVYKCTKKDGTGPYAVKQTACQFQQALFMKNCFNIVKMFDHQSIIKYKSVYITPQFNNAYLTMDWFPHPDLSETQLNQQQIKTIAFKILDAIDYMHQAGICHRDIKPDNILYDKNTEQIRIIDFGVSNEIRRGKLKKEMMSSTGTLYYKAPQMFRCGGYDQLIDEWAAGVTIYKLIANKTPFQSDYIHKTIKNIQKGVFHFKEKIWQSYDPLVKQLIKGLIAPRNKRLSANQAKKNLWFPTSKRGLQNISVSSTKTLKKAVRFQNKANIQINRDNLTKSLKLGSSRFQNKCNFESDYEFSDSSDIEEQLLQISQELSRPIECFDLNFMKPETDQEEDIQFCCSTACPID